MQGAMCDSYHTAFRTEEVHLWSSCTGQHFLALLSQHLGKQGAPATVPISLLPFHVSPSLPAVPHRHHSPSWPWLAYPSASPPLPMAQDPFPATLFHHKASKEQFWPRHFLYSFSTEPYLIFSLVS